MSNTTDLQYGDELIILTFWFKLHLYVLYVALLDVSVIVLNVHQKEVIKTVMKMYNINLQTFF